MDDRNTTPTARFVDLRQFRAGAADWLAADLVADWLADFHARRRRGTAAASRAALAAGADHVMLFTDLANATSNGVYARLGYRRVGDASEWTVPG
jgi:hypothetical protein